MSNHDQGEVERVLMVMRDAMRALVARSTITYDNQLSVTQKLIHGTFSGWEQSEVPANMSMLMRDLAIYHDDQIGTETSKITGAFEMAERWIREATALREAHEQQARSEEPPPEAASGTRLKRGVGSNGKSKRLTSIETVRATILQRMRESSKARCMDELIVCCFPGASNVDRESFAHEIRALQEAGEIVEVDLDMYAAKSARRAAVGDD